jgi:hypothetical protein
MIGVAIAAVVAWFGAVPAPDRASAACRELVVWHDTAYAAVWNPADPGADWAGSAGGSHRPVVVVMIVIAALAAAVAAFTVRHRRAA